MGITQRGMNEWLSDLGIRSVETINKIGEQIVTDAEHFTPVETGRLRDGWELNKITHLGEQMVISNSVEYAQEVEYGGLKNEPRMMLRKALAKVPKNIQVE